MMKLFQSLNDVTMYIVELILWYSPIGIFFLIAAKFASVSKKGWTTRIFPQSFRQLLKIICKSKTVIGCRI